MYEYQVRTYAYYCRYLVLLVCTLVYLTCTSECGRMAMQYTSYEYEYHTHMHAYLWNNNYDPMFYLLQAAPRSH